MKLILYSLIFLLFSCHFSSDLKKEIPNNLIPEEKFTLILEELMMLEHQIQTDYPQFIEFKEIITKNSKILFKKFNVTQSQFDSSFEYYASNQEKLKKIYAVMLERMTKKMANLELELKKKNQ